jgi:t-SNARE complex subunit (syntaxin)
MCKYAKQITTMIDDKDPQQQLIGLLSQQLSTRFDNLEQIMNLKIEHINGNVKNALNEVHNQLTDIRDDIKDIKVSHKEDKVEMNTKLDKAIHSRECPNGFDEALIKLAEDVKLFKTEVDKDIQWISAFRKNKWILILVLIGIVSVGAVLFENIYSRDINMEPAKKIIQNK